MRFFCPGCGSKYTKVDKEIPTDGMTVVCEKCGFNISVKPRHSRHQETVPPPVSGNDDDTPPPPSSAETPSRDSKGDPTERVVRANKPTRGRVPRVAGGDPAEAPEKKKRPPTGARSIGGYLKMLGTGRSGAAFRFRDLFYALLCPLDYRRLLVVGAAVFIASLLYAGLCYLGALTESSAGLTVGLILGGVLFWALTMVALGVSTHLTDREMVDGRRMPLKESFGFVLAHPMTVLGTPLILVAVFLALSMGVILLSLVGRLPYAGPVLYGLTFFGTFALSLLAILACILFGLLAFSYLPAVVREGLGPVAGARRMLSLIRANIGRYLLHLLLATLCSLVLFLLLQLVVTLAMAHLGWLGARAMGPDLTRVFLEVPLGAFGVLVIAVPDALLAVFTSAGGAGVQFAIAGWLVGLTMLAVYSLVMAFVLVYFFSAGVVNYHLLVARERRHHET